MISDIQSLRKRGYIEESDLERFTGYKESELVKWLQDKEACNRSIAARLLSENCKRDEAKLAEILLEQLTKEKKLYTKIEICKALEKGREHTARVMIGYLGKIGNNQYRNLPDRPSKKKSYPLPRDIIARSLGRMDAEILPVLLEVLESNDGNKISEVLDAIGYMVFYNGKLATNENLDSILNVLIQYKTHALIQWKGVISLSSFPLEKSKTYLKNIIDENKNPLLVQEAKRSLKIWEEKNEIYT